MPVLALSLFFTNPLPLDMPRAEAYLVQESGRRWLEDRYNRLDLWTSRTVLGRWMDDEGRVFTLSRLETQAPSIEAEAVMTRTEYTEQCVPIKRRDERGLRAALERLAPFDLPEKPHPPRQMSRGFADIDYWEGTNVSAVVCAFRLEKSPTWFLAVWELLPTDDFATQMELFTSQFLEKDIKECAYMLAPEPITPEMSEREQLRVDAHHSVSNYAAWHFTDSETFTILDDMSNRREFIATLTNDLANMRAAYAATLPTPIDTSNTLCVARLYGSREEYLAATDEDMSWTAAYWSPSRRELVAYLPEKGEEQLLRTIRHEAFHQYLSYATSMIATSPWLNEGYAEYFENTNNLSRIAGIDEKGYEYLASCIPPVLKMSYKAFYEGSDKERHLKYELARSLVVFIERGAPNVRFEPFKTLKEDYFAALFRTHSAVEATEAAFRNADHLKLFIQEWKKFWLNMSAD